jgi:hypothetical protein
MEMSTLEVEIVIAGVDHTGAHVYSVGGHDREHGVAEHFLEMSLDAAGYGAVGSGASQFDSEFMSAAYDAASPWRKSLLLAYSAKKRAEMSPGVGKATDLYLITQEGAINLSAPEIMQALDKYHKEQEEVVNQKRVEVLNKLRENPLFKWPFQSQQPSEVTEIRE